MFPITDIADIVPGANRDNSPPTSSFSSSTAYIDALLDISSWTGTTGQAANIGYSFERSAEGGSLFNATLQNITLQAMQAWSNVANITFSSASSTNAKLTFSTEDLPAGVAGLTTIFSQGTTTTSAEVQVDSGYTNFTPGTYAYLVLLHEIGHALGLKHPGSYGSGDAPPYLSAGTDSFQNTVMSYYEGALSGAANPPQSPMVYDIAALQYLYGANTSYNATSTAYFLNGTSEVKTFWDGGGTDILTAKNYNGTTATRIDLNEGVDQYTKVGSTITWNAIGANIENAEGSNVGDVMYGNTLANALFGRGGSDSIYGGEGTDSLYGGLGEIDPDDAADVIRGGAGGDLIIGNGGADTLIGGVDIYDPTDGADTIYGGAEADYIVGNAGGDTIYGGGASVDPFDTADEIYGGNGSDSILGNGGDDSIYGGGAQADPGDQADSLYGGLGDDYILGNGGNDFLAGQEDNDTLYGGLGNDVFFFDSGFGEDIIGFFDNPGATTGDIIRIVANIDGSGIAAAADVLAFITYADDEATIDFGGDNTITIEQIQENSLTAADFEIV